MSQRNPWILPGAQHPSGRKKTRKMLPLRGDVDDLSRAFFSKEIFGFRQKKRKRSGHIAKTPSQTGSRCVVFAQKNTAHRNVLAFRAETYSPPHDKMPRWMIVLGIVACFQRYGSLCGNARVSSLPCLVL